MKVFLSENIARSVKKKIFFVFSFISQEIFSWERKNSESEKKLLAIPHIALKVKSHKSLCRTRSVDDSFIQMLSSWAAQGRREGRELRSSCFTVRAGEALNNFVNLLRRLDKKNLKQWTLSRINTLRDWRRFMLKVWKIFWSENLCSFQRWSLAKFNLC